jgi:hypothetical protein
VSWAEEDGNVKSEALGRGECGAPGSESHAHAELPASLGDGVGGNVNRMLKWTFVEAETWLFCSSDECVMPTLFVCIRGFTRKNHQKAVVAVGRHFAEAGFAKHDLT